MRSWHRHVVAALALVAFSASTWATCVEGAASPAMQQMACCKNGHHTCGPKGTAGDCCKTSSTKQPQATVTKVSSIKVPAPVIMVWDALPIQTALTLSSARVQYNKSPPKFPLSPPAYIVFSTLLI